MDDIYKTAQAEIKENENSVEFIEADTLTNTLANTPADTVTDTVTKHQRIQ